MPLASAIEYSVGLVDMAIWGAIALVVQVAAFVVVKLLIPTITDDIAAGKQAQGFFLGALSLGVGAPQRRLHDLLTAGQVTLPGRSLTFASRSRTQSRHSANSAGVRAAITERSHAGPAQKSSSRERGDARRRPPRAMRAPAA